jgi:hypothetical protein
MAISETEHLPPWMSSLLRLGLQDSGGFFVRQPLSYLDMDIAITTERSTCMARPTFVKRLFSLAKFSTNKSRD